MHYESWNTLSRRHSHHYHTNGDLWRSEYSEFLDQVKKGDVKSVSIDNRQIRGVTRNNNEFITYMPLSDDYLLAELLNNKVIVKGKAPEQQS